MRILFTGYAPVHFVCFRPLYERLQRLHGVELFVSGGLRSTTAAGVQHDAPSLYDPFGIPANRILPVDAIRDLDFDVLFAGNTKMILPRSVGLRVQIFHGISFRNRAVRGENRGSDFYFMVGPYMRRQFADTGILPHGDDRALPIGFMKTDRLLNRELCREKLLWRYGLDGSRPVILYAPTGLKHNSLETMGEEVISRLVASDRCDLLIKLHDHPKNKDVDWRAKLAPYEGRHCRVVDDHDVVPLLFLADLLISDASSVSNEYTLLDRPMVLLDVPRLIRGAGKRDGSRLDLDTWGRKGGVVVGRPEDVCDAVSEGLASPDALADTRRAMACDLFYNPGRATDHAMAWVRERVLSGSVPAEASQS